MSSCKQLYVHKNDFGYNVIVYGSQHFSIRYLETKLNYLHTAKSVGDPTHGIIEQTLESKQIHISQSSKGKIYRAQDPIWAYSGLLNIYSSGWSSVSGYYMVRKKRNKDE